MMCSEIVMNDVLYWFGEQDIDWKRLFFFQGNTTSWGLRNLVEKQTQWSQAAGTTKQRDADGSCMDAICIVVRGIHRHSQNGMRHEWL